MPQALLPLIPDGATEITDVLSVVRENGQWVYFLGVQPVFTHDEKDRRSFSMFTAQLVCQGICQQVDIVRTFGVSAISADFRGHLTCLFHTHFSPRTGQFSPVFSAFERHDVGAL